MDGPGRVSSIFPVGWLRGGSKEAWWVTIPYPPSPFVLFGLCAFRAVLPSTGGAARTVTPMTGPLPGAALIVDPSDPRISIFLGLRDHEIRQEREKPGGDAHGSFIAEGDLVIERAVRHGYALRSVLVAATRTKPLPAACEGADIFAADDDVLTEITGRPKLRDPIARFDRPAPLDPAQLLQEHSRFAVLENVNNPNNMGVIMRNAAALGVDAVLLDPMCSDPLYRRAIRSAMGQVFAIPHARIGPLHESLELLHQHAIKTIALTPSGDFELSDIELAPGEKAAVLLGAEGPGLTESAMAASNIRAKIEMSKDIDSLNVANAAAIAFYEIQR